MWLPLDRVWGTQRLGADLRWLCHQVPLKNREALTLQKDPKGGIDQWIGFHGKNDKKLGLSGEQKIPWSLFLWIFLPSNLVGFFSASYWDLIWVNQPKRWLDTNSDCTFSWWNVVKHLHFTIQKRISRYFNQQGSSVLHQPGTSGIAGIARQCHSLPCWIGVHIWWIWWPCSYRVKTCYSTIHGANCTVHELYLSNQLYQTISNPMLGNQQHYIEYCAVMFAGLQAYSTLDISTVIPCL